MTLTETDELRSPKTHFQIDARDRLGQREVRSPNGDRYNDGIYNIRSRSRDASGLDRHDNAGLPRHDDEDPGLHRKGDFKQKQACPMPLHKVTVTPLIMRIGIQRSNASLACLPIYRRNIW